MAKNLAEVQAIINARIRDCLENEVTDYIREKMKQNIQRTVYSGENANYNRRYELLKDDNIIGVAVSDTQLKVMNIAKANDPIMRKYKFEPEKHSEYKETMFSYWINDGQWLDIGRFFRTGEKVKRAARPFIDSTQNEINANSQEIITILEKSVNKR
jgi:hypothetical protein